MKPSRSRPLVEHLRASYRVSERHACKVPEIGRTTYRYEGCQEQWIELLMQMREITPAANPNGSRDNIAGILNEGRNVLGMMPHPDRSSEALLGSADGWSIFASLVDALAKQA